MTLLTPSGRGAVATISVDGPNATQLVERCFESAAGKPLAEFAVGRIVFGRWAGEDGPGEELVVCRRGEQRVEVHCHGGPAAIENIVSLLESLGCRARTWQDAVRSELGQTDSLRAAARVLLAAARTERTAAILLDQFRGALSSALRDALAQVQSGAHDRARTTLSELAARAGVGLHLTAPWQVALVGRVNVGKSSLINALVGFERSIVFDQPGTTRDVVTSLVALDGWPVELADTAGLRDSDDPIETIGVQMARARAQSADIVILVSDLGQAWSAEDAALHATFPAALLLHNKCDVASDHSDRPAGLRTSALTGDGIEPLIDEIVKRLVGDVIPRGAAVPFTTQQCAAVHSALDALTKGDSAAAESVLRQILADAAG